MRWPEFDKSYPGWGQWESAKDFLVNWALDDQSQIDTVDKILARKTVRATLAMSDDPLRFLWAVLDSKGMAACGIDIEKGNYDYGEDIVSCAGAAFERGALSLASLTAVYDLHASCVNPAEVLHPEVASAVQKQPCSPPMLPGLPDMMPSGADGIGVSQARRVFDFFLRAWRERWSLQAEGQKPRYGQSIRSCSVADNFAQALRKYRLSKPCMFRWYECRRYGMWRSAMAPAERNSEQALRHDIAAAAAANREKRIEGGVQRFACCRVLDDFRGLIQRASGARAYHEEQHLRHQALQVGGHVGL